MGSKLGYNMNNAALIVDVLLIHSYENGKFFLDDYDRFK